MPEATPEFLRQCTRKNTLTITRRRASRIRCPKDKITPVHLYIWRNSKYHAITANRPKAQQLWTNPTNRTKFLQCDYAYINTICEHLVHWWNYVKPPLGKIQPTEPKPQPFRQPLSKDSAASTSQYSSVSSVIRSTISHVSDRGRQWTSNVLLHSPSSPSSPINRRGAGVSLGPQSTAAAVVPDPRSEPHPMQRFLGGIWPA